MIVKNYQDGKIITLSKAFDTRAKILNIIYFAAFTFAGLVFIFGPLSEGTFSFGLFIFITVVSGIYLFAAYRFINKALQTEQILVNKNTLTILKKGFLSVQKNTYDINLISNFRHLDKPEITKHPLAGQTFDYLGFQTEQQVINELHGDNRLGFDYNGKTIKFGNNIYSWEFEELKMLLNEVTGNDFRYIDKFEKSFKPNDESQQEI